MTNIKLDLMYLMISSQVSIYLKAVSLVYLMLKKRNKKEFLVSLGCFHQKIIYKQILITMHKDH